MEEGSGVVFGGLIMSKGYYGSNGDHKFVIETPDYLKNQIKHEFGEYFDPCPVNPTQDGLAIDWPTDQAVYVNPPYTRGNISKWVKKCSEQHQRGCTIILLIPSYTDTAYFHDYIYQKTDVEIRFIRGRIKFKGYENQSSFASMMVIFENYYMDHDLIEEDDRCSCYDGEININCQGCF